MVISLAPLLLAAQLAVPPVAHQEALKRNVHAPAPSIDLMLPSPITDRDLEWYGAMLALSQNQNTIAEAFVDEYESAVASLKDARGELLHLSRSVLQVKKENPVEYPREFERVMELRARYSDDLHRLDAKLFEDLKAILTGDQTERFEGVTLDRVRAYAGRIGSRFPAAGVDLIEMIRALGVSPLEHPAVVDVALEYLRALHIPLRNREHTRLEWMVESNYLDLRREYDKEGHRLVPDSDESILAQQQWKCRRGKMLRRIYHEDRTIASLNKRFVPRFVSCFDEEIARALLQRFRIRTYPNIYPDYWSAQPLLLAALEMEDLAPYQQTAIDELLVEFRAGHEARSARLCHRFETWREFTHKNLTFMVSDHREYADEMIELERKRREFDLRVVARLENLLTDAQLSSFLELIRFRRNQAVIEARGITWSPA